MGIRGKYVVSTLIIWILTTIVWCHIGYNRGKADTCDHAEKAELIELSNTLQDGLDEYDRAINRYTKIKREAVELEASIKLRNYELEQRLNRFVTEDWGAPDTMSNATMPDNGYPLVVP